MIQLLSDLTIAELTAWVIVVALNAYVVFGGADFGGGVWDLFASGPRKEAQRRLIAHAIAPADTVVHLVGTPLRSGLVAEPRGYSCGAEPDRNTLLPLASVMSRPLMRFDPSRAR